MDQNGLYKADDEHSSCGVGLVVAINGKPSRRVVQNGIEALKAVWHRGAVDADGKTGDGAGIHVQIPVKFFYDQVRRTGHEPDPKKLIAVGQVFLPRTDFGAQERCRTIVETEVLRMGHYIYGWRHVPVNTSVLGEKGQCDPPRDRTDPDPLRKGHRPRAVRARALHHPPPDRKGGHRPADRRACICAACPAGRSSTRA
jgi:glutamate synthase (NADPH/NADH) large chain